MQSCVNIIIPLPFLLPQYQPTWNGLLELLADVELDAQRKEILIAAASKNGKLYAK